MKLKVNDDVCIGCGACQAICSEVFQIGDDGLADVIVEEIADDIKDDAKDALDGCPVGAIEEISDDDKDALDGCPVEVSEEIA